MTTSRKANQKDLATTPESANTEPQEIITAPDISTFTPETALNFVHSFNSKMAQLIEEEAEKASQPDSLFTNSKVQNKRRALRRMAKEFPEMVPTKEIAALAKTYGQEESEEVESPDNE